MSLEQNNFGAPADLSNGGGSFTAADDAALTSAPPAPIPVDDDAANPFAAAAPADNGHAAVVADMPLRAGSGNANDLAAINTTAPAASSSGGGAAPAPSSSPPAPRIPSPTGEDPRLAVERASAQRVAAAQRDEAAKKAELASAAKAYLAKQTAERKAAVDKRRAANRAAEASSNAAAEAVPRGDAPWTRVLSIVDFHAPAEAAGAVAAGGGGAPTRKDPFKDLARFKACLLDAKKNSIGV